MPKYAFLSQGSTTTVKSGAGNVYGVAIGGANGGGVFILDAVSIGATPDYNVLARATASNIAILTGLDATPRSITLHGAQFTVGLTVSATSNAPVSVFYD